MWKRVFVVLLIASLLTPIVVSARRATPVPSTPTPAPPPGGSGDDWVWLKFYVTIKQEGVPREREWAFPCGKIVIRILNQSTGKYLCKEGMCTLGECDLYYQNWGAEQSKWVNCWASCDMPWPTYRYLCDTTTPFHAGDHLMFLIKNWSTDHTTGRFMDAVLTCQVPPDASGLLVLDMTVEMPTGDAWSDGVIDDTDMALVNSYFGESIFDNYWDMDFFRADLNNDTVVDIFDLVLVGDNYGQAGWVAIEPTEYSWSW